MQRAWRCFLKHSPLKRLLGSPQEQILSLSKATIIPDDKQRPALGFGNAFTPSIKREEPASSVKFKRVAPFVLVPRVIIYDGVCHLCNAGVRWVIRVDKDESISFCAVQSEAAEPYLIACEVSREDVLQRFIFVEGPGLCHSASTAALKVASYLPFPYSALSAFLIIPAPIRDAVYDYVAKHRYHWFGRSDECIVPSDDILHRFIDKEEMLELREKRATEEDREYGG